MSAQQRRASERGEVGLDPRCDDVTPLRLGIDAIQIAGFDPVPLYELVGVTRGRGGALKIACGATQQRRFERVRPRTVRCFARGSRGRRAGSRADVEWNEKCAEPLFSSVHEPALFSAVAPRIGMGSDGRFYHPNQDRDEPTKRAPRAGGVALRAFRAEKEKNSRASRSGEKTKSTKNARDAP